MIAQLNLEYLHLVSSIQSLDPVDSMLTFSKICSFQFMEMIYFTFHWTGLFPTLLMTHIE